MLSSSPTGAVPVSVALASDEATEAVLELAEVLAGIVDALAECVVEGVVSSSYFLLFSYFVDGRLREVAKRAW